MNNYDNLVKYVKRNRMGSTFDANTLREKLNVEPKIFQTLISKAVNQGLIQKINTVPSTVPSHKGRQVGVYSRSINSYQYK